MYAPFQIEEHEYCLTLLVTTQHGRWVATWMSFWHLLFPDCCTWIQSTRFILNICAHLRANGKVLQVNCIVWSCWPNPVNFLVWGIREGFLERIFSYFSLMLSHSPSPLVGPSPTLMSPFCHAGLIIQHSIFNLSLFPALQISLQLLSWWDQQSERKNLSTKHSFVFYF